MSYAEKGGISYVQSGNAAISDKGFTNRHLLYNSDRGEFGFVRAVVHLEGLSFEFRDENNQIRYEKDQAEEVMD
jgi:hypothetical protein